MSAATPQESAIALVSGLVGMWEGEGKGGFPTLEPFRYREELRFTRHAESPILQFIQQTWRFTPDGEVPSHWETGYLRVDPDGSIVLFDTQESGRKEILRGTVTQTGKAAWEVALKSESIVGDNRMVSSSRTLRLNGTTLDYEMSMATDRVSPEQLHLQARLRRRQEG